MDKLKTCRLSMTRTLVALVDLRSSTLKTKLTLKLPSTCAMEYLSTIAGFAWTFPLLPVPTLQPQAYTWAEMIR